MSIADDLMRQIAEAHIGLWRPLAVVVSPDSLAALMAECEPMRLDFRADGGRTFMGLPIEDAEGEGIARVRCEGDGKRRYSMEEARQMHEAASARIGRDSAP